MEEVEEVIGKMAEVVDKWENVDKSGRGSGGDGITGKLAEVVGRGNE